MEHETGQHTVTYGRGARKQKGEKRLRNYPYVIYIADQSHTYYPYIIYFGEQSHLLPSRECFAIFEGLRNSWRPKKSWKSNWIVAHRNKRTKILFLFLHFFAK